MSLDLVLGELDNLPNVVSTDMKGVLEFTDGIAEVFGASHLDVYVSRAVMEVENAGGYPIGHIVFDAETDMYRFIPYADQTKES